MENTDKLNSEEFISKFTSLDYVVLSCMHYTDLKIMIKINPLDLVVSCEKYFDCGYMKKMNTDPPTELKNKIQRWLDSIEYRQYTKNTNEILSITDKEKIILKKLRHQIASGLETEDGLIEKQREILLIRKKINEFIQTRISKKVIPIEKIDPTLVSLITKENKNKADAKIISSAIQEHQENELIAFTLDKNDWKIIPIKEKIENLKFKCPEVRFLR